MDLKTITGNRWVKLLTATVNSWMDDNALRLSAALSYYSIFSIAPLLIIAISVAGLVFGVEAVQGQVAAQMKGFVGPLAAESVQSMIQSASRKSDSWMGASIGFTTLMLGASGVFGQLKDALNTIWEVKPKPGVSALDFIRERLLSFGMVLVIGFLLLVSLLATTMLAAVSRYFEGVIGIAPLIGGVVGFALSFGVATTLFALIFKILPDVSIRWKSVWVGAVVTGLLFEIGKFGLSYYLGRESTSSSFGAAGSVVLLLLWVYYASCILLFGAEFTRIYAKEAGHRNAPAPGMEAVSTEDRAQQGLAAPKPKTLDPVVVKEVVPVPEPAPKGSPLGEILLVIASTFFLGLLAQRRPKTPPPIDRLRDALNDMRKEAGSENSDKLASTGSVVRGWRARLHLG